MKNRYYPKQQRKPATQRKGFFSVDSGQLERAQKVDNMADSVLKAMLWFGYGVALMSWFVAVNSVILFSRMLKIK